MTRLVAAMLSKSLAVCLVLVAVAGPGSAQLPTARQLLTNIPQRHPAVHVEHTFPRVTHPGQIVAGEVVTALITVRNTHSSAVNVTYVSGSIANPNDFSILLDNFTVTGFLVPVKENSERSFEYRLKTHANMPNRDFRIALTVFYEDMAGASKHAATFFNQTVEVVEAEKLIDTEAFALFGTLAAILGAIGYTAFSFVSDQPWYKGYQKKEAKKRAKGPVVEESAAVDKSDYLTGTPYARLEQKRDQVRSLKKGK